MNGDVCNHQRYQLTASAFEAATQIVDLFNEDRERITVESDRGSGFRIHELFQQNPFHTANQIAQITGLSAPTVNAALSDLERLSIVDKMTGRKRGRVFSYRRYLAILREGTEPPTSQLMTNTWAKDSIFIKAIG